jgi:hypothetical protein
MSDTGRGPVCCVLFYYLAGVLGAVIKSGSGRAVSNDLMNP